GGAIRAAPRRGGGAHRHPPRGRRDPGHHRRGSDRDHHPGQPAERDRLRHDAGLSVVRALLLQEPDCLVTELEADEVPHRRVSVLRPIWAESLPSAFSTSALSVFGNCALSALSLALSALVALPSMTRASRSLTSSRSCSAASE